MGRLIDAEALKLSLRKQYDHYKYRPDDFAIGVCVGMVNAMEELDIAPTIDAIPVKWLKEKRSENPKNEEEKLQSAIITAVLVVWERAYKEGSSFLEEVEKAVTEDG